MQGGLEMEEISIASNSVLDGSFQNSFPLFYIYIRIVVVHFYTKICLSIRKKGQESWKTRFDCQKKHYYCKDPFRPSRSMDPYIIILFLKFEFYLFLVRL
jgi:hypothetical protein